MESKSIYPPLQKKEVVSLQALCIYYSSEFRQLIGSITDSMENGAFLNQYKQSNPKTWKEAKNIGFQTRDAGIDLYSHLMGIDSLQYPGARELTEKHGPK